jgi:hypothetical protein
LSAALLEAPAANSQKLTTNDSVFAAKPCMYRVGEAVLERIM